jgi:hypothetical protein
MLTLGGMLLDRCREKERKRRDRGIVSKIFTMINGRWLVSVSIFTAKKWLWLSYMAFDTNGMMLRVQ